MKRNFFLFGVILIFTYLFWSYPHDSSDDTIKIGVLHSKTGTMAISEESVIKATMFAIEEINQNGGLLGKKVQAVFVDGQSKADSFYKGAHELITKENVDVVFGCWTSASRKTVKPLFEDNDNLLIYPIQFEGIETSPNIFYTGLSPNQQVLPSIKWAVENLGSRVYLVGSEYIYPRATNALVKDMLLTLGIKVVGEAYIPLGSTEVDDIVYDIVKKRPDVIINSINGDTNLHFFEALENEDISSEEIPIVSFSLNENEYTRFAQEGINVKGHYTATSYLSSDRTRNNQDFIQRFHTYIKENIPITDPMISAYIGVHLWAKAVKTSSTSNPKIIKDAILQQTFEGPDGIIFSDRNERKLFQRIKLGRVDKTGVIQKVWEYDDLIPPLTFPHFRSKKEWKALIDELFKEYDQKWEC